MRPVHSSGAKKSLELAKPGALKWRMQTGIPSVSADLCYVGRATEPLYNYLYDPPGNPPLHNCRYEARSVRIADARRLPTAPSVHVEGFELREADSAVVNFRDADEVVNVYYQECADLARAVTGGSRAYVFDHQVRRREEGRPPLTFGRRGDGSNPAAAGRIHNDYTESSGRRRLPLVITDPAEADRIPRYCIVNIWRSIGGPVMDTPLALCQSPSVAAPDLQVSEVRYPDRTGEIYLLSYSPRHRWFFYPEMDRHEALIFKQYDSQASGVARYTPHAAFDLPLIPRNAPLRESVEVRCLVVMD